MKTKTPFVNVSRRFALRLALTLFVGVALGISGWLVSTSAQVRADSLNKSQGNVSKGLQFERERREEEQQQYLREHSDPSGKVRPEAYVKGIEHVRRMKVAPYIGAKPIGETTPTPNK